jgi:hypothetical protein
VRLEVTEAVLNHLSGSRAGIVGIFQRHDWAEEKRTARDSWVCTSSRCCRWQANRCKRNRAHEDVIQSHGSIMMILGEVATRSCPRTWARTSAHARRAILGGRQPTLRRNPISDLLRVRFHQQEVAVWSRPAGLGIARGMEVEVAAVSGADIFVAEHQGASGVAVRRR